MSDTSQPAQDGRWPDKVHHFAGMMVLLRLCERSLRAVMCLAELRVENMQAHTCDHWALSASFDVSSEFGLQQSSQVVMLDDRGSLHDVFPVRFRANDCPPRTFPPCGAKRGTPPKLVRHLHGVKCMSPAAVTFNLSGSLTKIDSSLALTFVATN